MYDFGYSELDNIKAINKQILHNLNFIKALIL